MESLFLTVLKKLYINKPAENRSLFHFLPVFLIENRILYVVILSDFSAPVISGQIPLSLRLR